MHRIRSVLVLLLPIPFLIGMVLMAAAFWQNDAEFVMGRVQPLDAVLVDSGPAQPARGRPRYFPTFKRLADGQLLTVERAAVATELPPLHQPVQLLCSTRVPGNCRMPSNPGVDRVFYGVAGVWSLFAIGVMGVVWGPYLRRALGRARA